MTWFYNLINSKHFAWTAFDESIENINISNVYFQWKFFFISICLLQSERKKIQAIPYPTDFGDRVLTNSVLAIYYHILAIIRQTYIDF